MLAQPSSQSKYVSRWSILWILSLAFLLPLGCFNCSNPEPQPDGGVIDGQTVDGSNTEQSSTEQNTLDIPPPKVITRACPNQMSTSPQSSFVGQPCASSATQNECNASGCQPSKLPKDEKAPGGFFSDCSQESVLCVGKGKEVETLTAAVSEVKNNNKITTIRIAIGKYEEAVIFQNINRKLTFVGESNTNDPTQGAVIVAPAPQQPSPTYAALQFINVSEVVVSRLVLSGQGHGLYAEGAISVGINNDHLTANLRTGAWLKNNKSVTIQSTRVIENGATLEKGVYQKLHFGLEIEGSKAVVIENSEVARNGSGGIAIAGSSTIAVGINNDHRVADGSTIAVGINNDHRTTLKGNSIHHNGPLGRANLPNSRKACTPSCSNGTFCEAGVCHLPLQSVQSNQTLLLGVGLAITGSGDISIVGNSIFGNDTTGAVLVGAKTISLQENVLERNGVRPVTSNQKLKEFAFAGLLLSQVQTSVTLQHNLITDNVTTGVLFQHKQGSQDVKLTASSNNMDGNGRFLKGETLPQGDGISLDTQGGKAAIQFSIQDNNFTNNLRSGFNTVGAITGEFAGNTMTKHIFRAVVLHDTGTAPKTVSLLNNNIDGAQGYGIQVYGGAAALTIEGNRISNLASIQQGDKNSEADGINLTNLTSQATVRGNLLEKNVRAGIFVDNSKVQASGNVIQGSNFSIAIQKGTSSNNISGSDSSLSKETPTPFSNKKNF